MARSPAAANGVHGLAACEHCGQPARVRVLEGYAQGEPQHRHYCIECATEIEYASVGTDSTPRPRIRAAVLVGIVGVAIGTLAVFADTLVPQAHVGFGWYQRTGVAVGATLALVGALLRADLIALVGVFTVGGALCMDCFGLTHSPGLGWKQQALLVAAVACVLTAALGPLWRRFVGLRTDQPISGLAGRSG